MSGARRRGRRSLGVTLVTVALALVPVGGAVADHRDTPAPYRPAASTASSFSWAWADGSVTPTRTFAQSDYRGQSLPRIIVTTAPTIAPVPVYLQFFQEGSWNTEAIVPTNAHGQATISLDPYCEDGSWCDGTYGYRLRVGRITSLITVVFDEN